MTFTAIEQLPLSEVECRYKKFNVNLKELNPNVGGSLVFSRATIYYFTGTFANGVLWLPVDGEPVLLVRKGIDRCRLESPLKHICSFKSYGDVDKICQELGQPLSKNLAAEMKSLSWSLANLLQIKFKEYVFCAGDMALEKTKAVKTAWEVAKLKIAGKKQVEALRVNLPKLIQCGMSERQIASIMWDIYFELEHDGMMHMANYNEEIFLGNICTESKDESNQNLDFIECMGVHASMPYMGYAGKIWEKNTFLHIDTAFAYEGYHTSMQSIYWSGDNTNIFVEFKNAHEYGKEYLDKFRELAVIGESFANIFIKLKKYFNNSKYIINEDMGMGLGLSLNAYPQISMHSDIVLEENMVFTLNPRIEIHKGYSMVVKETCLASAQGLEIITDADTKIHIVG